MLGSLSWGGSSIVPRCRLRLVCNLVPLGVTEIGGESLRRLRGFTEEGGAVRALISMLVYSAGFVVLLVDGAVDWSAGWLVIVTGGVAAFGSAGVNGEESLRSWFSSSEAE